MNKSMQSIKGYLHSKDAEEGAKQLIHDIKSGKIRKATLPNSSPNFTGDLEYEDYVSFYKFLESANGKTLMERLEENSLD